MAWSYGLIASACFNDFDINPTHWAFPLSKPFLPRLPPKDMVWFLGVHLGVGNPQCLKLLQSKPSHYNGVLKGIPKEYSIYATPWRTPGNWNLSLQCFLHIGQLIENDVPNKVLNPATIGWAKPKAPNEEFIDDSTLMMHYVLVAARCYYSNPLPKKDTIFTTWLWHSHVPPEKEGTKASGERGAEG